MNTMAATVAVQVIKVNSTAVTSVKDVLKDGFVQRSIVMIALCLVGMLLNFVTLSVIAFIEKLRRRRSNKFLLNLLCSNVFATVIFLAFISHSLTTMRDETRWDKFYDKQIELLIMACVVILLTIINLISLTLDRLLAVKYPFFYQTSIKTKHVYIIISIAWILSLVYAIILVTVSNIMAGNAIKGAAHLSFFIIVLIGFITLAVSNSFIYFEAKKQLKAISAVTIDTLDREQAKQSKLSFKELKLVRITVGIVTSFIVHWIPLLMSSLYNYNNNTIISFSLEFEFIAWYMACCNYIWSPMIYVALSRDVKMEIKRLIKKPHAHITSTTF